MFSHLFYCLYFKQAILVIYSWILVPILVCINHKHTTDMVRFGLKKKKNYCVFIYIFYIPVYQLAFSFSAAFHFFQFTIISSISNPIRRIELKRKTVHSSLFVFL